MKHLRSMSLDSKLSLLAEMRTLATQILEECTTGECAETDLDATAAIENAVSLARELVSVVRTAD